MEITLNKFGQAQPTGNTVVLKRLFRELGGKSANIILDDADLDRRIPAADAGMCVHAGQGCMLPTRLLAPRSSHDAIVERAAAEMTRFPTGIRTT